MSRKSFKLIPVHVPSEDDDPRPPSKSHLKRESTALQELGERLAQLSRERLKQLPMAEKLYDAIREAQRITAHEGRRRQMQYVGKLMRDAHIEPIQLMLAKWDGDSREEVAAFHQLEIWRDKLIDSDDHFTGFMNRYPAADAQHMRAMIRAARKEQAVNATLPQGNEPQRKQFRALFQEIKRLQAEATGVKAEPGMNVNGDDDEDDDD
jgi:ribosome-associated protein